MPELQALVGLCRAGHISGANRMPLRADWQIRSKHSEWSREIEPASPCASLPPGPAQTGILIDTGMVQVRHLSCRQSLRIQTATSTGYMHVPTIWQQDPRPGFGSTTGSERNFI